MEQNSDSLWEFKWFTISIFFNTRSSIRDLYWGNVKAGPLSQLTHHVQAAVITPEAQVEDVQ